MSKKKKRIIIAVSMILAVAITAGALILIPRLNQKEVDVYPVSRIREQNWGDQLGSYGNIMAGNMQTVYLDTELLLESIDVSVGDEVAIGDTLLCYDMTIQNLNIKTLCINIDILANKIKKAEQELADAKALVASEPPPAPPMPAKLIEDGSFLTDISQVESLKAGGSGSREDPFIFNCAEGVSLSADFLKSFYSEAVVDADNPENDKPAKEYYAIFRVYYFNNVLMYQWRIDGDKFQGFDMATLPETFGLSSEIHVDPSGPIDTSSVVVPVYAAFEKLAETVDYIGGPHYSQAEIDRMVNNAENQLASLSTEMKQKKLDLEIAREDAGDGTVKSEINGIVAEVGDPDNLEAGQALIVIQSGKGYRVEGTISELNRDKLQVGQAVTVNSWSTGGSYVAEITEIMDFPARYNSGSMGMENPVNSYYTFVAMIDTDEVLTVGDWVEISIDGSQLSEPSDTLYLPNAFVREEDGQSYVLKTDEEGKLIRQYVRTGKSLWGYAVEIKGGLSFEDNIAFPYGKQVKEGAPTVVSEGMYW